MQDSPSIGLSKIEYYPWQKLSEDTISGKLSDERFQKLSADYEKEQHQLQELAAVLRGEIEAEEQKSANVERFLSVVERYMEIPELTPCILHEFVEKIVVHAASDPKGKNRTQEIDIYYKGIGALEVSKVTSSRQEWEKRHSRSYTVSLLPHDVFLSGGTFHLPRFFFAVSFSNLSAGSADYLVLDAIFSIDSPYFTATASISNSPPLGSAAAWTQERAGASPVK